MPTNVRGNRNSGPHGLSYGASVGALDLIIQHDGGGCFNPYMIKLMSSISLDSLNIMASELLEQSSCNSDFRASSASQLKMRTLKAFIKASPADTVVRCMKGSATIKSSRD